VLICVWAEAVGQQAGGDKAVQQQWIDNHFFCVKPLFNMLLLLTCMYAQQHCVWDVRF
jgi:hypothetical protein